ncbi:hypothetical protein [Streptomyces sp. WAC07149]|uniref:hypothetical protein n=1 Tax=Streptomyces sp. WAC07149 TaxID=2487425 RepID=UPI00163B6E7B|nr:hypothetical protein [Streptomyces sp. WAC07149]
MTGRSLDPLGTALAWLWAVGTAAGLTTVTLSAAHAAHANQAAPSWSTPDSTPES